jgi:hypothetical protein
VVGRARAAGIVGVTKVKEVRDSKYGGLGQ